jgi:subtilase family serine protease
MRFVKAFLLLLTSTLCLAQSPVDRLTAPIESGLTVPLKGNLHGGARPEFDQGRVDPSMRMYGVSLVFKPSPEQQSELDQLLAEQQDRLSPNFHKGLTPAQFADRFGMSQNDINKVVAWLQSQSLTVTRIANSRNEIFFSGTAAQIELSFHTELHNYLVDGENHFANASEPSVPAALSGVALAVRNLHNFLPKSRARIRKVPSDEISGRFTSHISGGHFLSPADFATIYNIQPLYLANVDGSGQKIAVIGQSAISTTDVDHFRSAAGLSTNDPQLLLVPGSGIPTHCSGDEDESDLDVEWSGGVAKNATIIFVYEGIPTGQSCTNRTTGAFDALRYAIDQNIAPIISISYGLCENTNSSVGITQADALALQGSAKQANTQLQTIVSATGDSGAADCDSQVKSAAKGMAVDVPAAIPEVTGVGGTEFQGDVAGAVTGVAPNTNAGATNYWSGTTNSTDPIASALSYIPEMAWNDTAADIKAGGNISASGGGASIFFSKPSWQTGAAVPADNFRHVPDVAVNGSVDHDGYLICSPTDSQGNPSCTNGFRDSSTQGFLDIVGGTSAGAPTLAGILALLNQTQGNTPPTGLGNINPNLYLLAQFSPGTFHDVTTGDNIVPCTQGTRDCPTTAPFQFGFMAGPGYDQVTGLGSINAKALADAWSTTPSFTLTPSAQVISVVAGQPATANITVNLMNGFNSALTFSCSGLPSESTCTFSPPGATTQTMVTLNIATTAPTAQLRSPFGRSSRLFYAVLLPGVFGMVVRSRKRVPLFYLIVVLSFSTLWLAACGGSSSSNKNPGTPKGSYTVKISATTAGSSSVGNSTQVTLTVN